MRIHKEGVRIILVALLIVVTINLLVYFFVGIPWLSILLIVGALVLMGLIVNFFHDPERIVTNREEALIYSPADGTVVVMEEVTEPEYFKDRRLQISIFMSIYDVHANRSPIGGKIDYFRHHEGKYLLAKHPKSSTENERTSFVFQNSKGNLLLRQIAGAVARRIKVYVKEGQQVVPGEEIGFIKFGSRADIFLPLDAKVNVTMGQHVKGGIDVIAEF